MGKRTRRQLVSEKCLDSTQDPNVRSIRVGARLSEVLPPLMTRSMAASKVAQGKTVTHYQLLINLQTNRRREPKEFVSKTSVFCIDENLEHNISEELKRDPKFRDQRDCEVLIVTPQKHRPAVLKSRSAALLKRSQNYGHLLVFTEADTPKIDDYIEQIQRLAASKAKPTKEREHKFFKTSVFNEMPIVGKRYKTQNAVMQERAKDVALQAGKEDCEAYEWLHSVAHRFLGRRAQVRENLTAGTRAKNMHMLEVENAITRLIEIKRSPTSIDVDAELEDDGKISSKISYVVNIDGLVIPLEFAESCDESNPKRADKEIIRALFEVIGNQINIPNMDMPIDQAL